MAHPQPLPLRRLALSPAEVSSLLRLSRDTVIRMCLDGTLADAKKVGTRWVIPVKSVEAWIGDRLQYDEPLA